MKKSTEIFIIWIFSTLPQIGTIFLIILAFKWLNGAFLYFLLSGYIIQYFFFNYWSSGIFSHYQCTKQEEKKEEVKVDEVHN
jgi:hypothetical protein